MSGVQNSLGLGGKGEQQKEGKHDANQRGGQLRFAGDSLKSRGKEIHDGRAQDHAKRADTAGDGEDHGPSKVRKLARFGMRFGGEIARERGHEGRRKSAFREKLTHEVGNTETQYVSVVGRARSEQPAEDAFPNQASDPTDSYRGGDDAGGLEEPLIGVVQSQAPSTRRISTSP